MMAILDRSRLEISSSESHQPGTWSDLYHSEDAGDLNAPKARHPEGNNDWLKKTSSANLNVLDGQIPRTPEII
jgi:hypothetical protein